MPAVHGKKPATIDQEACVRSKNDRFNFWPLHPILTAQLAARPERVEESLANRSVVFIVPLPQHYTIMAPLLFSTDQNRT